MTNIRRARRGTRSRRLSTSAAVAVVAVALLTGCSGDAEEQPPSADAAQQTSAPPENSPAPADDATTQASPGESEDSVQDEGVEAVVITISDFSFDVPDTIAPGTQVTIRNEDQAGHTVTSDEEGLFDVLVGGGQEETFTVPDQPGEYPFFCTPHPSMVDTLVIG